jgi:hypothetical protein
MISSVLFEGVSSYGSGREIDGCPSPAVKDKSLLRSAGVLGREHEVKTDSLGTNRSLSLFDLCGCKDGRVVVKAHGCKGPIVAETGYRWR